MKILSAAILFLLCLPLHAEYRVYQYYVKAKYPMSQDQQSYLTTSTLDPVSYMAYHGGSNSIEVDLLRSWICLGNTAKEQFCPAPLDKAMEEAANTQQNQGV